MTSYDRIVWIYYIIRDRYQIQTWHLFKQKLHNCLAFLGILKMLRWKYGRKYFLLLYSSCFLLQMNSKTK